MVAQPCLRRRKSTHRVRVRQALGLALSLVLTSTAAWAGWVEHPGVIPDGAQCQSCHAAKVNGKSVHSAMATPCTVCHVTMTQGDMTSVGLSMPKGKICFACHQESAALRQHVPRVEGQCVECHDAHSSERKMLLLVNALEPRSAKK